MKSSFGPRFGTAFALVGLLGVASVLGALPVMAQGAAPAASAPAPTTAPAPAKAKLAPVRKGNSVEARIKSLHDQLKVTAAQEAQWQAVADAMRDGAKATADLIQQRVANAKTMTAVDDLRSYQAIAEAHAAGLKSLTAAFETFYDGLSPEQKHNADAIFRQRPRATRGKAPT